jgi:hypothetical protein
MSLEEKDDLRHALRPGPFARESLFYDLVLPEERLLVFTYTWVDSADRVGHLFAVVTGDDQRLAVSAAEGVDAVGRDFDDWRVDGADGSVWVRHHDLLTAASYGASAPGARLDVEFTGIHEPFDYLRNDDGCPPFVADNRFEQAARVTGTLELGPADGRSADAPRRRRIAVDATGHRDHSWGTRDWDTIQDWKWVSAQVDDSLAVHVMEIHGRGRTTHHGYALVDGVLSPVDRVRIDTVYDDRFWQTRVSMTVLDKAGRTTELSAERFAMLAFAAGEGMALHEAGCHGTLNGRASRVHVENGWDRAYAERQVSRAGG